MGSTKRPAPPRFSREFKERAVAMVFEAYEAEGTTYAIIPPIAERLGISRRVLYYWVRQAEAETGRRPGLSESDRDRLAQDARVAELERENRELRRANEILKTASAFFAAELDRPRPG